MTRQHVYECPDGTPFPVEFHVDGDAEHAWVLEVEHGHVPQTPMSWGLQRLATPGLARAYEEAGMTLPRMWHGHPDAQGFWYFSPTLAGEGMVPLMEGCTALVERYGSALGVWEEFALPRIEPTCERLAAAGPAVPLADLTEWNGYVQQLTMLPAFILGNDHRLLEEVIGDAADNPARTASELTQGFPSPTLSADEELWQLADLARSYEELVAILRADDEAGLARLEADGQAAEWFDARDRFLERFGARSATWTIDTPTWSEPGSGFPGLVGALVGTERPADAVARGAERREALIAELEGRLSADADRLARFRRRLERMQPYVHIREDRAHWQLVGYGLLRHAVLRHGQALVEGGRLDTADDVRFLSPEQATDDTADLRTLAADGRRDHERWMTTTPPTNIGAPPPPDESTTEAPGGPEPAPIDAAVTGVPASRGRAEGVARVIVNLVDADRLQPGEILVCRMTSPPWTPLFGIAAGLVTDGGDLGAHAAIAAREYGLPAVVGTGSGTAVIPDGATVVVDGDAGTVEIVG